MPYKDKEQQREYQRKWLERRREKFIVLFGGACCKCGSVVDLEFDHRDQKLKEDHRIWSWSEDRILAELEKCSLVCRECHQEKTVSDNYQDRQHGTNTMYTNGKCRCVECREAHAIVNARYK